MKQLVADALDIPKVSDVFFICLLVRQQSRDYAELVRESIFTFHDVPHSLKIVTYGRMSRLQAFNECAFVVFEGLVDEHLQSRPSEKEGPELIIALIEHFCIESINVV